MSIQVTVWNEYRHEINDADVRAVYPDGIHAAIAAGLQEHADLVVRTATLDEPDQGLPPCRPGLDRCAHLVGAPGAS